VDWTLAKVSTKILWSYGGIGGSIALGGGAALKSGKFAKDKSRAVEASVDSARKFATRAGHAKNIGRLGVGGMVVGSVAAAHGVMQTDMNSAVIGGGILAGGMMASKAGYKRSNELIAKRDKAADKAVRTANATRRGVPTNRRSSGGFVGGTREISESVTRLRQTGKMGSKVAMGAAALSIAGGAYAAASSGLFGF